MPTQDEHQPSRPPFDLCERTFQFALRILNLCIALEQERPGAGWILSKQLLKAGTSVGANVEEGQAAESRADFVSKYSISRKEVRESNYWLRLVHASRIFDHQDLLPLISESEELRKILTSIIMKAEGE